MRGRTETHRPAAAGSPNIYAALADLARRSSDGALASASTVGVFSVIGIVFLRWEHGVYLLPLVAVGAFGVWGMAERDRVVPVEPDAGARHRPAVADVVQWLAVAVGTLAAAISALTLLGTLVGRVIS